MKIYFIIIFDVIYTFYKWCTHSKHMFWYIIFHVGCMFQIFFCVSGEPNIITFFEFVSLLVAFYGAIMLLLSPFYYESMLKVKKKLEQKNI